MLGAKRSPTLVRSARAAILPSSCVDRRGTLDISWDTEIYDDLGIHGDVLYFDRFDWVHGEFGTTFEHFNLNDLAQGAS